MTDTQPAHAKRALLLTPRGFSWPTLSWLPKGAGLILASFLLAACDAKPTAAKTRTPAEEIEHLVEALTPMPETWTSDVEDAWFQNTVEVVGELRGAGPEVGREALRYLQEEGSDVIGIEIGLLTVAAFADPEGTQPYLEELIFEYGYAIHRRAEAVTLLAKIAPQRAVELFDPHLRNPRQRKTYPDAEFFVRGYIEAANKIGLDPVDLLADVTTNIWHQDAARHFAVRELGNHPSEIGRQALQITLIESTGNGYLRILAAQSLVKSLPRETACGLLATVANREANRNFLQFLIDVMAENCK